MIHFLMNFILRMVWSIKPWLFIYYSRMVLLNVKNDHWKEWWCYIVKFKITLKIMGVTILLANYIMKKYLIKLDKTHKSYWMVKDFPINKWKYEGVLSNYVSLTKYGQKYLLHYMRYPVILEGYNNANWIFKTKDPNFTSEFIFNYWRSCSLLKIL